jgi:hypothetical protein
MRTSLPLLAVAGLVAAASTAADAQYYPYSYYGGGYVSTTTRSTTTTINPGMHTLSGSEASRTLRSQPRVNAMQFTVRQPARPARAASSGCPASVTAPLLAKTTSSVALTADEAAAFRRCFGRPATP